MEYIVSSEEHGYSLLAFLEKKSQGAFSLKKIKKMIDEKKCKVSGRVEFFSSRKLAEGDRVEIEFSKENGVSRPSLKREVLFEDPDFIVINKPAGVICVEEEFLHLGAKLVHRLDKDTSGLLLLAKNLRAETMAKKLFLERTIEKKYLALVDGKVPGKRGIIDNYLGKVGGYEGQTVYGSVSSQEGKRAITEWTVLETNKASSLILCDLKTGRTHQIRVHLSSLGHPILGDHQYAKKGFACLYNPSRHLLHAWKLLFIHPKTKKEISLVAPIPADFKKALKELNFAALS